MSLYAKLFDRYGPLLTPTHLEEIFHRPYGGIRWGLEKAQSQLAVGRPADEFYTALLAAKSRKGKNVYFSTQAVAAILDDDKPNKDAA